MRKPVELFFFFSISNTKAFKAKLKRDILPLITTTTQIFNNETAAPSTLVNIAFSQTGLFALNLTGDANNLNDPAFAAGQVNDVKNLSDPGTTNWVPQFVGTSIHGVILFGSDTEKSINRTLASLQSKLGNTIVEKYSLRGAMRPPPNKGHERESVYSDNFLHRINHKCCRLRLPGRDIEPYHQRIHRETRASGGPRQ
jgi:hypothetical protein